MPSKKQRRRREKSFRHEYEYVLLDEEGNEVPAEPTELRKKEERPKAARGGARPARAVRTVQPASWQRVAKRGLLFAPVMFIMVTILGGSKLTTVGTITQDAAAAGVLPAVQLPDGHVRLPHLPQADRPQQLRLFLAAAVVARARPGCKE